ncbi:hypothetical protein QL285_025886 [Trifolium repens]|nr:hypothetical protein QL285_025886 [Trifolium repens]
MGLVKQEITELRREVITLRSELEQLEALVTSLLVTQNQPPTSPLNLQVIQHETSFVKMVLSQFQGLSLGNMKAKENMPSISSLKDARKVVQSGLSTGWGRVVTLPENHHREGLGSPLYQQKLLGQMLLSRRLMRSSTVQDSCTLLRQKPKAISQVPPESRWVNKETRP